MGHVARSGAWCGARAPRTQEQSTPVGFEPTRGDPIGLAGRRLSHSAKVSMSLRSGQDLYRNQCTMAHGTRWLCAASPCARCICGNVRSTLSLWSTAQFIWRIVAYVVGHGAMVMLPGRGVRAGSATRNNISPNAWNGTTWVQKGLDMIGDV